MKLLKLLPFLAILATSGLAFAEQDNCTTSPDDADQLTVRDLSGLQVADAAAAPKHNNNDEITKRPEGSSGGPAKGNSKSITTDDN
ncbi:MAG TPA: hypothetical protein PLH57_07845 [Oligoflexia bacterium]|nr:hypothetical protein [Oligoflexia bacterium]